MEHTAGHTDWSVQLCTEQNSYFLFPLVSDRAAKQGVNKIQNQYLSRKKAAGGGGSLSSIGILYFNLVYDLQLVSLAEMNQAIKAWLFKRTKMLKKGH